MSGLVGVFGVDLMDLERASQVWSLRPTFLKNPKISFNVTNLPWPIPSSPLEDANFSDLQLVPSSSSQSPVRIHGDNKHL